MYMQHLKNNGREAINTNYGKCKNIILESNSWYSRKGTRLTKDYHVTTTLEKVTTNYIMHTYFHISYVMFSSFVGPERTGSK
jgi:hypothetical protein